MAKIRRRVWQGKDGINTAWEVDIYIDGTRHKKSGFKLKKDAEEYLKKIEKITEEKESIDKDVTFRDAANNFMDFYADIHCKPSTIEFYDVIIRRHLIPYYASRKVYRIKPELINQYIKLKLDEELSNKTINHHLTLLHNIFNKLIENGRLINNPMRTIKRLKLEPQEMLFLHKEDINRLLDCCKEHYLDFYPLLLTAIFTGMRKGELLALTWDDINLKTAKIRVAKTIYKGSVSSPKSNKARVVDMAPTLAKVLKEHKLKCVLSEKDLVFCNQEGNYLDPDNIIKRRFEPCLRKAGLDRIRFHDLRHTYASMLISENVPVKYIQAQLGHSSIQVTMDRYGHIMPEVHDQAVKVLDGFIVERPEGGEKEARKVKEGV